MSNQQQQGGKANSAGGKDPIVHTIYKGIVKQV
jgi:hypothetical protein